MPSGKGEGKILMPDDDPKAFEMFRHQLYKGSIGFERPKMSKVHSPESAEELDQCIRTCIFGHKYGITALQNIVMLRACDILATRPTPLSLDTITQCYDATPAGSQVRTLAAEFVVHQHQLGPSSIGVHQELFTHAGFVTDMLAEQQACYQAPKDFPRYSKSRKFKSLFRVNEPDASEANNDGEPSLKRADHNTKLPPALEYADWWDAVVDIECLDCYIYNADISCDKCMSKARRTRTWSTPVGTIGRTVDAANAPLATTPWSGNQ